LWNYQAKTLPEPLAAGEKNRDSNCAASKDEDCSQSLADDVAWLKANLQE
jgi:hypothetical protein